MTTRPSLSIMLRTFAPEAPASWEPVLDLAVAADRAGVGSVTVSDHVVFGENLEAYGDPKAGGQEGGRQPTGPDGHWLEPLTFLAVVAGRTQRVRLGTYILIAALRRPAVLAKQLATLDVLSGGRVDLGVGVGWQREEYEACGLDYDGRGRLLDHTLEVCEVLWTEQRVDYRSPELQFSAIHQMPKPLQEGGVPLWVSGTVNPRAMRRLADFGAGWIPWGPDAADLTASIPRMREAVAGFGRDPSAIGVVGTLPVVRTDPAPSGEAGIDLDATMAGVPALAAAGVTDFRAHLPIPSGVDAATEYLTDVVGRFEAAIG